MSVAGKSGRLTALEIRARKGREPIVALTAYSTPVAKIVDPVCDFILVGDSLGMVVYGLPTTLGVTLDMMIAHGRAVMRGSARACVVVDMPFGSYQASPDQAFRSAARILAETGCSAIKLEGGQEMAETVAFLVARGIPVLGHIGLTPQAVNTLGGFKVQGKGDAAAAKVMADARAISDAGAFGMVVEGVVEPLARDVTAAVPVPTIGIGASAACDGQILVSDDVFGLFSDFTPKFAKRYAEVGQVMAGAVERYATDVRSRAFPGPEHTFKAAQK